MVIVLTGAGASYDVVDCGKFPTGESWRRPPLADELFDFNRKPEYELKFLAHWHGANMLAGQLAGMKGHSLEQRLFELAQHADEESRRWFKDVPPYIRDVIVASADWTRRPRNYDKICQILCREHRNDVTFLTLNYDTFLERAIGRDFATQPSYIDANPSVVKLHGSVDWWYPIGELREQYSAVIERFDPLHVGGVSPGHFSTVNLDSHRKGYRSESYWLFPAITAPLAGKDMSSFVCPSNHLDPAKGRLARCTKLLIMGASGVDGHVLELLEEHLSEKLQLVHFVGYSPKYSSDHAPEDDPVRSMLARFRNRVTKLQAAESHVFHCGVSAYVDDPEGLDAFARPR
jgi:hypothetical protein